ncbi:MULTISPECIES: flagellar filament capping protein FliD [Pseudomonas]|uniref:flagellar filament capping protein FliD n=1 Tax=Pseudomonas TaxID=286 RepID=UPI0009090521|nr:MULTISPECIES: flagellar filament capping protein FliD [Pseudomonas]TCV60323.1 flagellar hook-associated protein 2 [Pseudomonas fluorescens]SFW64535.1 flagellar hook-associated protein 2 [Pseudomonas sp. NFACC04-2]
MASPILPGLGLGSGLDTTAIVKVLVDSDKAAKQGQITRATTKTNDSISGVGTLKSLLAAFKTAMKDLSSTTTPQFSGFAATSSTPAVLTATASNSAVGGTYAIKVDNIATASKVTSAAFAGGTSSAIPSGTLTIKQNGVDYNLNVASGATLQSVRDAINADTSLKAAGFSANIITDSFGSRLVLGSSTTGAGSDISVSGIAGLEIDGTNVVGAGGAALTATSAGAIGALAQDAKFSVDGMALTSKSNTVSTAISGLTLNLLSGGPTASSTVTVAPNNDGLKASIQKFVDAYNAIANSVTALTKPSLDDDGKLTVSAKLTGDALPRALLASIRTPLSETGAGDKLTSLAQLGITTDQKTGALNFDTTKFNAAMNDKKLSGEVQTLFTGTNGLLERMGKAIEPYSQTGGILDQRSTTLTRTQTRLKNDQEALDRRVVTLTATLTKKYNDMDALVGKLKATANNITSMFEAMAAQQKNS